MKVAIIIVGIGQWEEYTKPLIESIREYESNVSIVIVDNGGNYDLDQLAYFPVRVYHLVTPLVSYASAINVGLDILVGDEDWIIVMNNDVLCTGHFVEYLSKLDTDTLYGNNIHHKSRYFIPKAPWIDGWIYAIPNKIFTEVGDWDENFKRASFEDADYSYRAVELGYKIGKSDLPFKHLQESIRKTFDDFKQSRFDNIKYLMEKHGLKSKESL
jgi:GT2 family glycosyltransferase